MRAAIYCRVSSQDQVEHGLSIPAQKKALYDYAARNRMEIIAEYIDEGESAFKKRSNRIQFQEMIQAAKQKPKPFDVILVHKWDRFARNREDSIVYKKLLRKDCGIDLISITEPIEDGPVGMLMEGILELLAEFYSVNLSQEVKKGMTEAATKGKPLGKAPLGFKIENGKYVTIPKEIEIIKYLFEKYATGEFGLRTLSEDIYTNGLNIFGEYVLQHNFTPGSIYRILKKRIYRGEFNWNGITISNAFPPIVSIETFDRVQKILDQRRIYRSHTKDYLLRGIVKCMECGGNMSQKAYPDKRSNPPKFYRYLQCTNYTIYGIRRCYHNVVPMEILEDTVFNTLKDIANGEIGPDVDITFSEDESLHVEYNNIISELKAIPEKIQRLVIAYENSAIDLETLKMSRKRLIKEQKEKENKLRLLNKQINEDVSSKRGRIYETVKEILHILDNHKLPISTRRNALCEVVKSIEYSKRIDYCRLKLYI